MGILWHVTEDYTLLLKTNFIWLLSETFFSQSIWPLLYEYLLFAQSVSANVPKGFFFISTPVFPRWSIIFMPSLIISKHWISKKSPQIKIFSCLVDFFTLVFQECPNSSYPNLNSSNCSKLENRQTRFSGVLSV